MTHEHGQSHGMSDLASSGKAADIDWDERYSASEQIWSGQPNGALVAEVDDLTPGRALDIGCGEGADAVWLAREGWTVTALDVSRVALDRAEAAAREAGLDIDWIRAGFVEASLPAASFDLVSAQYPVLLHTPGEEAAHALFDVVAPGGTLLFVHHAMEEMEEAKANGCDPADYLSPDEVAAMLPRGWKLVRHERRPRHVTEGAGAHHVSDVIVRIRRPA